MPKPAHRRHDISDAVWTKLEPHLPGREGSWGGIAQNNRLFKMSPLHHHYQKSGFHESKIVNRMVIIGVMLAIVCLITLKIR